MQHTGNGHPGTAMSLAPLAHLLYQQVLRHDPADELSDLKALRTWGSATPGHPEYRRTRGVEITTGPLGQGFASAVGMAMAVRRERGLLDPDAPPGQSPFDHRVHVLASDGDMMEGVTSEASSLAAHQRLGELIVFYDQNHISIEDDTDVSFSEDVATRYRAYGWHVQHVDWTSTGGYVEDVDAVLAAIRSAEAETSRPSLIVLRTVIGWPAPTRQNTGKAHGSTAGAADRSPPSRPSYDPSDGFVADRDGTYPASNPNSSAVFRLIRFRRMHNSPRGGQTGRRRSIHMVPLILVLLLALLLFGAGFAVKILWWVAIVVLVVWLLGFVSRSTGSSGSRGRWYRW